MKQSVGLGLFSNVVPAVCCAVSLTISLSNKGKTITDKIGSLLSLIYTKLISLPSGR